MYEHKIDIIASRFGCLGSSDGKMLATIAKNQSIPKSAYKRLAVVKGLIEQTDIPENAAIRAGNEMEMCIYEHLKANDERWESNVRWESKKYSKKNVKLISHPDLTRLDYDTKVLHVIEVKTTKYTFEQTRATYAEQLYIHSLLANEVVKELGDGWRVELSLCVYNTDGLDLTQGIGELDPSRLTVKVVRVSRNYFDIDLAMNIVNDFLETFDTFYEGDEIDADYLPVNVKEQFLAITSALAEIKEREAKVDEFKQRLYDFMCDKDIRTIKCDAFTIYRVDPSEQKSFDAKAYLADMQKKYPRKTKKIIASYTKTTKKKGYSVIKLK